MLFLWTFVNVTFATPVVLHRSADPDAIRSAIIQSAGVPIGGLTITHFDAFRANLNSKWSGLGEIADCQTVATDSPTLTALTKSAEGKLMYMELEDAAATLSTAADGLRCLTTPVDAAMAARIGFLRGVVSVELGDKAEAWEHFATAARYQPDLIWDEQFPKTGEALLKAAKSELSSTTPIQLAIVPTITEEGSLYVNGAQPSTPASSLALTPGEHLIQVQTSHGITGYTATLVAASTPSLLLPEMLADDALAQVATEEGRSELSRLVSVAFESGTPVYVAHDDLLWRTASGFGAWENLRPEQVPALSVAGRTRSGSVAWLSAGITTTVAIGTVSALLVGLNAGKSAGTFQQEFDDAASQGDFDAASSAYGSVLDSNSRRTGGYVAAGIGAALTMTGVVITIPLMRNSL
jgi:hypothetical protein